MQVDGDRVRLPLVDLLSWHAVLGHAVEHGAMVSLGELNAQRALDGQHAVLESIILLFFLGALEAKGEREKR